MPQSTTTRMPNGLTNAAPWQTMADAGMQDPVWAHNYFDDFYRFAPADWVVTAVGTGAPTGVAYDGGAIILTNSAGIADAIYMQKPFAIAKLTPGKDVFFKFEFLLSEITNCTVHCGMIATSATPLAAADGVYVTKAAGQTGFVLVSKIGGVATSVAFPAACVATANTEIEIGIHITKKGDIEAFFNPSTGANAPSAGNARGPVARIVAPAITQVLLNPSFGILNTTAAARSMTVDFIVNCIHN